MGSNKLPACAGGRLGRRNGEPALANQGGMMDGRPSVFRPASGRMPRASRPSWYPGRGFYFDDGRSDASSSFTFAITWNASAT
jgi:hypothetical protein